MLIMDKLENISSIAGCSFSQLVGMAPIRIPKIQRDYAQGRRNDSVDDIRNKFVDSLVDAVRNGTSMEMDFIYGSNEKDCFEPLDGQQRLTTMFLLHWMLGVPLYNEGTEQSVLSYETRNTSKEFTDELVRHKAAIYQKEIENKKEAKKVSVLEATEGIKVLETKFEDKSSKEYLESRKAALIRLNKAENIRVPSLSELIQSRDWFDYLWKYDPTIQSMLVMIDTIQEKMDWKMDIDSARKNLGNITFSYLNLGYFGLSDELFIKMNARGKQLSPFDITKSTLEEEIQTQIREGHCNSTIEAKWRSMVDGEWIDWFWNMFAAPYINEITESDKEYHERLSFAKASEEKLKRLILRIIALEFQTKASIDERLDSASYNDDASCLDRLMTIYQESLRDARKDDGVAEIAHEIDFSAVIEDISALYYKDGGIYRSIFDLVPESYRINENVRNATSLDIFLDEKDPNDARIIFYAILEYLKKYPVALVDETGASALEGKPDSSWLSDFIYWAHACRNIFINDNNNVRIDRQAYFKSSISGVKELVSRLGIFRADNNAANTSVMAFFASITANDIPGIDNQSLAEERKKAVLCQTDPAWITDLSNAEEHSYLWGQVRALIDWSGNDRIKFNDYHRRLVNLLDFEDSDLVHACMVALSPDFGFKTNNLFVFYNKDRDYSMKRYLRDETSRTSAGYYAPAMKVLLDKWINVYPCLSAGEFLSTVVKVCLNDVNSYHRCLVCRKDILEYAGVKKIFENNGHYILAQKKTKNSRCYDIALLYLYKQMSEKLGILPGNIHHYNSADIEHQYALTLKYGGVSYLVQQIDGGAYELHRNSVIYKKFDNEKALLDYFDTYFELR